VNDSGVSPEIHAEAIELWLPVLRPRFRNWTTQEIYYARRLLSEHIPNRDHFLWELKTKVVLWLIGPLGDKNPLSVDQWATLSGLYVQDYEEFLSRPRPATQGQIDRLIEHFA
jgi:hypothetical protein